jgi:hypothetical protein
MQTGLHHTGILLHRTEDARYEIYLTRTFTGALWEWLTDAALPLGYDVDVDNIRAGSVATTTLVDDGKESWSRRFRPAGQPGDVARRATGT